MRPSAYECGARPRTANDRLKAGEQARLHRSIVASVVLHVAVVVGLPAVELSTLDASGAGAAPMQLVSLGGISAPTPLLELAAVTPLDVPEPDVVETPRPGSGNADEEDGSPGRPPEGWEGRPAELWRLAGLRAGLAPPVSEPVEEPRAEDEQGAGTESSDGTDEEGVSIRQRTEELEYQRLTEEERLSLERLSALRPELVFASHSSWLVLRNPDEVATYLRSLGTQMADGGGGDSGLLSVSLWVDEQGSVEWAEINRSSGQGRIDQAALELFREIIAFQPARENSVQVPVAAIFWLLW